MCMKNINTDITFFSDVDTLLEVQKEPPLIPATYLDENILEIPTISFLLSINAIERIHEPVHDPGDTMENAIFFNQKYELCFRLTEPTSGKFIDLDTYEFTPAENQISLCRKIFSRKISCQYHNVKVAVPQKQEHYCVLKILVRLYSSNLNWIVQSMHPIRLEFPLKREI